MKRSGKVRIVARNRRAGHDYVLLERFEAGIILTGTEVKSVRGGQVSLQRSFVQTRNGELWLFDAHIAPYEYAGYEKHDPTRPRKLLLSFLKIKTQKMIFPKKIPRIKIQMVSISYLLIVSQ